MRNLLSILLSFVCSFSLYGQTNTAETTKQINKIKLSIGESSRALIRRKPKKILVKNPMNPNLAFIRHMASIKNIDVTVYDTMDYECITIIN